MSQEGGKLPLGSGQLAVPSENKIAADLWADGVFDLEFRASSGCRGAHGQGAGFTATQSEAQATNT